MDRQPCCWHFLTSWKSAHSFRKSSLVVTSESACGREPSFSLLSDERGQEQIFLKKEETVQLELLRRQLVRLSFLVAGLSLLMPAVSQAQSGQRVQQPNPQTSRQAREEVKLGYEGYCPVCIVSVQKWVKGVPEHQVKYDGLTYYFPDAEIMQKFNENPAAYVPVLGGDCTVCLAKAGKRVAGNIRFASLHENRVYLFPSSDEKEVFDASPADYENVDLAADGNCIVCLVKMNKQVPGTAEFTAVHNGFRYLFPSDAERQVFLQAPTDYVSR